MSEETEIFLAGRSAASPAKRLEKEADPKVRSNCEKSSIKRVMRPKSSSGLQERKEGEKEKI